MKFTSGDIYNGDWYEGQKTGNGYFQYHDGERYEGKWLHDLKHGLGVYYWMNGDKFVGEFYEDHIKKGVLHKHNGEVVELMP